MKHICIALTFILVTCSGYSQKATVADVHIQYWGRDSLWHAEFNYPFIASTNQQLQDSINFTLINDIAQTDSLVKIDSTSIRKILQSEDNYGMVDVEYNITLKADRLLGIDLLVEWSGAYPYNTQSRFLFNLENGQQLTLADIIRKDRLSDFSSLVYTAYKDSLNAHILYLINDATERQIDTSEIDNITQLVIECRDEMKRETMLETSDFYFEGNRLIVAGSCWFPHAIIGYQPFFNIPYQLPFLQQYLLPEIYQQLVSQKAKK